MSGRIYSRAAGGPWRPDNHLLRKIDRFVDLSEVRAHLGPYYSDVGRPSIDPELMIRMLIVGYCFGIRSERRLCEEVHLNLAYRWFCRLGLDADVPDHSTFSKNRHGRFRESDLLRKLFETVVARCMKEGIVGGEAFAVDASLIVADAHRRRGVAKVEDLDPTSSRAVAEYLSVLDDAAFGGATPVEPKAISPTDPAARYTAAADKPAVYAYSDNYLIDLKHAVIMDVEATTAIKICENWRSSSPFRPRSSPHKANELNCPPSSSSQPLSPLSAQGVLQRNSQIAVTHLAGQRLMAWSP